MEVPSPNNWATPKKVQQAAQFFIQERRRYSIMKSSKRNVLQNMPIYLLSTLALTSYTFNEFHKIFQNSFEAIRKRADLIWASWLKLCFSKQGGLDFRSLFDISKALFSKLWWEFRITSTLWSNLMWTKYCKRYIPTMVQWKRGSQL
ncbi:hypothetical protein H5410_051992 [Solanum commersonii]|uniref:Uncharacterized protein n=1 Tax=Solanum commersonii TaxID=4109 RepID=A0A9J5X1Q7_SOLCO|nr:hypothetical protein H5410_051992 [Solanum commersonii]